MLIVDTSAVIEAVAGSSPDERLIRRLSEDGDLHAPHLIDVEVLHALRGLERSGQLTADRVSDARRDFAELTITRYPHAPLADRVWDLRHNVTPYDATFLVLAEITGVPLITCDKRLSNGAPTGAAVELYGVGSR